MRLALAAAGAIVAGTVALLLVRPATPVRTVQLSQARAVMEGPFEPAVVCDDAEKFARYTQEAFGVAVHADFADARRQGVSLLGWTGFEGRYGQDLASGRGRIGVLLARGPNRERVAVVFRRAGRLRFATEQTRGYRLHSMRLGPLEIDEISTLDRPVVLPLLSVTDR